MTAPPARPSSVVFYPTWKKVPDSALHGDIVRDLLRVVRVYLADRGRPDYAGSDQFWYWVEGDPHQSVAPDLYVVDRQPPAPPEHWKTWTWGGGPTLAVEVVSKRFRKDYVEPKSYDAMGVRELILYDPVPGPRRGEHDPRVRFRVYRRRAGRLVLVARTDEDRVRSAVLGAWLREERDPSGEPRLHLATGRAGDRRVALPEDAERVAKERERVAKERERVAKEDALKAHAEERDRRAALEDEVARLREELERLRGGR